MPIHNSDVAEVCEKVANLLEIQGENPFRIRAYRDAAREAPRHSRSTTDL